MEREIEELKELMRRNIALTEDTHRMVRNMRKGMARARFFRFLWFVLSLALIVFLYYYYVEPHLVQIESLYTTAQKEAQIVQSFTGQVSH